jgi:hypothetical protein
VQKQAKTGQKQGEINIYKENKRIINSFRMDEAFAGGGDLPEGRYQKAINKDSCSKCILE